MPKPGPTQALLVHSADVCCAAAHAGAPHRRARVHQLCSDLVRAECRAARRQGSRVRTQAAQLPGGHAGRGAAEEASGGTGCTGAIPKTSTPELLFGSSQCAVNGTAAAVAEA